MASQEDVNRQHMAAMGLDPDSLGKPTPKVERCDVVHPDQTWLRCRKDRGHDGLHMREGLSWEDEPVVTDEEFKRAQLSPVEANQGRCTSHQALNPHIRCLKPEGHDGTDWMHENGEHYWSEGAAASPRGRPNDRVQCAAEMTVDNGMRIRCTDEHAHSGWHHGSGHTWENLFKQREGDQPLPVVNDHPDIQAAVIADIEKRRELGIQRYGTALQPNNGRDMLLDAYDEAIDLAICLKGAIVERDMREGS